MNCECQEKKRIDISELDDCFIILSKRCLVLPNTCFLQCKKCGRMYKVILNENFYDIIA